MALEVVSQTSLRKDLETLLRDYARAGVEEYWIADAREGTRLRIHVLVDGAFVEQRADDEGWIASPLFERSFRLREARNPAGLRDFQLELRP